MLLDFCCVFLCVTAVSSKGLKETFTWTRIDYDWKIEPSYTGTDPSRSEAEAPIVFEGLTNADDASIFNGQQPNGAPTKHNYNYENNIPMGANVWRNKLFITVPRRKPGVPSTLNYVQLSSTHKHNVPLIPYPDWKTNVYPDPQNCGQNIVSVYRVGIDVCDRMWFVDTGKIETPGNITEVQPTALVAIDLKTDKIILRYNFPTKVLKSNSSLVSVEVDVTRKACGEAFVYIPDLSGYGVIVYSLKENKSWRVNHDYFFNEPNSMDYFIAGHNFQLKDGVFSLELTALLRNGFRDLYFHPLSSTHMYRVSTRIMRNEKLSTRSNHGNDFEIVGDRGPNSQTSQADIDMESGIMFLNMVNRNAVGCWNTNLPLNTLSMVHRDDLKMIYPSDIKIANGKIFVLTNTMPEFLFGKLDYDQVNFRIWMNSVEDAITGTMCEQKL